jgi:hypothetical protein
MTLHHYFVVYVTTTIYGLLHYYKIVKYYKIALVISDVYMPIEEKKQLVTSLRIDPEIWKQARVEAIQHDITLTQLVEEAINCWIKEKKKEK